MCGGGCVGGGASYEVVARVHRSSVLTRLYVGLRTRATPTLLHAREVFCVHQSSKFT